MCVCIYIYIYIRERNAPPPDADWGGLTNASRWKGKGSARVRRNTIYTDTGKELEGSTWQTSTILDRYLANKIPEATILAIYIYIYIYIHKSLSLSLSISLNIYIYIYR